LDPFRSPCGRGPWRGREGSIDQPDRTDIPAHLPAGRARDVSAKAALAAPVPCRSIRRPFGFGKLAFPGRLQNEAFENRCCRKTKKEIKSKGITPAAAARLPPACLVIVAGPFFINAGPAVQRFRIYLQNPSSRSPTCPAGGHPQICPPKRWGADSLRPRPAGIHASAAIHGGRRPAADMG
jgi:hypothetical protein